MGEGTGTEGRIRDLQRWMVRAARSASVAGNNGKRGRKQRWWTEKLEEKKAGYRLRRGFQRAREIYRVELREYSKTVREAKQLYLGLRMEKPLVGMVLSLSWLNMDLKF